jgi:hypothetical protein
MSAAALRLADRVTRFEAALAHRQRPLEAIAQLGEPRLLGLLFEIVVQRLVRMGPAADATGRLRPADLLGLAQQAAAAGAVGAECPARLRRILLRAERVLRLAGAWAQESPCWWQPLPAGDGLEELWGSLNALLDGSAVSLRPERLVAAFAVAAPAPGWLSIPALIPPALCRTLHEELETAHESGWLELQAGTVGQGQVSAARADAVRYLDGLEDDLLRRLPRLAILVQWCLLRLVGRVAESLPGRALYAPRTAMLARYPAPSGGYQPHFDNPGGEADNGRELALLVYLNAPQQTCAGGELALWDAGTDSASPPGVVLAPAGGSVALFDCRSVAHQVRPLEHGPPRWSLAIWLNRAPQDDLALPSLPEPSLTDLLVAIDSPPLPAGRVLWHDLDGSGPGGTIQVRRTAGRSARAGVVATVYGAGAELESWCRHHIGVGFAHLILVFDRLEEAAEADSAARLRAAFPASQLTIWSTGELAAKRWRRLAAEPDLEELIDAARRGASAQAVAARQTLNASSALAVCRTDELGGAPLDWLLHLDADELFWLPGRGRGGSEAGEHFAGLSEAGVGSARYVNHELLLPRRGGDPARFKRNPREARARLGTGGWQRLAEDLGMRQTDPRPYFNGYLNGKSAVASAVGVAAAGVHGWRVAANPRPPFLAGPAVLHLHFASAESYCRKYLRMADSMAAAGELFEPCRTELMALDLVRSLRRSGADDDAVRKRLMDLRDSLTHFSDEEVGLLLEAGLILEPAALDRTLTAAAGEPA